MSDFIARIGTFFLLIGIVLALLFIASDTATAYDPALKTNYNYLCLSVLLLAVGYFFRKRAAPPPAADRFKFLRKMRENAKKKKEEKAKAQQQKK
jgi:hypothetical protein